MNATGSISTLLGEGTRVRIQGLVNSPELNGQEGSITASYSEEKKRYEISIGGKKKMLLKPENVEMLRTKQPTFANIDDMMANIGNMGLDPDTFADVTPEQKQKMFRMTKKLDRGVDVFGHLRRLRMGIDNPSLSLYEEKSRMTILKALVPFYLPHFSAAIWKAVANEKDSNVDLLSPNNPPQNPRLGVAECSANFGLLSPSLKACVHNRIHECVSQATFDSDENLPKTPRHVAIIIKQNPPTLIIHHDTLLGGYDGDEYDEYTVRVIILSYFFLFDLSCHACTSNLPLSC
jgi:hypothetical protein